MPNNECPIDDPIMAQMVFGPKILVHRKLLIRRFRRFVIPEKYPVPSTFSEFGKKMTFWNCDKVVLIFPGTAW